MYAHPARIHTVDDAAFAAMSHPDSPFSGFTLFNAKRIERMEQALNEHFEDRFYISGDALPELEMNRVILTHFELYGGHSELETHTQTDPLQAYYFVYIFEGSARCDNTLVPVGNLICFNIHEPLDINWGGPDGHYVMLRIRSEVLTAFSRQLDGVNAPEALRFPRFIPLDSGPGLTLDTLLKSMIMEMADETSLFSLGITTRQTEELFLLALLHNAESFSGDTRRLMPLLNASEGLRKAVHYATENLQSDLSLELLAAEAGVSKRALQSEFAKQFGTGPMTWLKKQRLQQVHRQLRMSNSGGETVTTIAARWGFTNPSNFANLYRREFGELPSETLKRYQRMPAPSATRPEQ